MIAQKFQLSISSFKQSASLRTFPFSYVAGGHIRSALWVGWPEDQIPKVFVSWHCTGNPRGSLRPRAPVFAIAQRGCGSDRPSIVWDAAVPFVLVTIPHQGFFLLRIKINPAVRDTEVLWQIHFCKETNPLCGVGGRQFDFFPDNPLPCHSRNLTIREGIDFCLSSTLCCRSFLGSSTNRTGAGVSDSTRDC